MRTWLAGVWVGLLLGGSAVAGDAMPDGGLVEVLPVGEVLGDGSTPAVIHLLALYENGAPMTGLRLRAEVSAGTPGEVIEVGEGLYRLTVTPPRVDAERTVRVTVRGRTEERTAIEASREVVVRPAAGGGVAVTLNPVAITLGVDAQANVSLQVPAVGIDLPAAEDLDVHVSSGEVSAVVALGGGRYTARYTPPRVNYPHLAIFTVVDRRRPDVLRGYGVVPLQGKVDYPVQSKPGATVILRLGDREFGPVTAGSDGRAFVPIVVPPGMAKATKITVQGGVTSQEDIDLGVPEGRRLQGFPVAVGVPSDASLKVPVRFVVLRPDGSPDTEAALDLTATAGRIGRPNHLGAGVYEAIYSPPDGRTQMAATIQATVPGSTAQSDAVEITLLAAMPGRVSVSTEPTQLAAEGTGLKVFARVLATDGVGLSDRAVRVEPAGATLKGPVQDLKGGDYRADLTADGGSDVVVQVIAPPAVSGNALAHVVVLPSADQLPPDGVTSSALLVATTDAWGFPVPNVPVELSVASGGGALPTAVTTDAYGMARVYYTAGSAPGLVAIEARAGGHLGAAGLVLAGVDGVPHL
ncbi:MAG TPA: Ig-like domain-containing protein, partial [Myxococcota bacterium]|nr:Ig-like domain-containing protein [Myxococcota bacterium]